MNYKSKLTVPIMMEENKLRAVQEELTKLNNQRHSLVEEVQKEKEQIQGLMNGLLKGEITSSSFFSRGYNRVFVLQKESEIEQIGQLIENRIQVYQQVKKKVEKMVEIDQKRKKEHLNESEKKEERETEELRSILKHTKKKEG